MSKLDELERTEREDCGTDIVLRCRRDRLRDDAMPALLECAGIARDLADGFNEYGCPYVDAGNEAPCGTCEYCRANAAIAKIDVE